MTLNPDVQVIRDECLLPYVGGTRQLYTYYLDRYLDWCGLQSYEPLTVTRADVERYEHHLHIELGLRPSSVATALTRSAASTASGTTRGRWTATLPSTHGAPATTTAPATPLDSSAPSSRPS